MQTIISGIKHTLNTLQIPKFKNTPKRNNMPLIIRQRYNQIYQLNALLSLLKDKLTLDNVSPASFTSSIDPATIAKVNNNFTVHWNRKHKWLLNTIISYASTLPIFLPKTLNSSSEIQTVIMVLKDTISSIQILITKDRTDWNLSQITKFIDRRNDDLKVNQTRMLNSILECQPKQIILDHLKYYDGDEIKFTNEINDIKQRTNTHYQTVGLDNNHQPLRVLYSSVDDLPFDWQHIYQPILSISSQAYAPLMDPITHDELSCIIRSLPTHKAAGPSGIPYDLIKKLPSFFIK